MLAGRAPAQRFLAISHSSKAVVDGFDGALALSARRPHHANDHAMSLLVVVPNRGIPDI